MKSKFFVPFETAKLLKEKGYPQLGTEHYYNINGDIVVFSDDYEGYTEDIIMRIEQDFFAALTYHEVLDWLDGKGIYVSAFLCIGETDKEDTYKIWWKSFIDIPPYEEQSSAVCSTREEALNNGIIKALKML